MKLIKLTDSQPVAILNNQKFHVTVKSLQFSTYPPTDSGLVVEYECLDIDGNTILRDVLPVAGTHSFASNASVWDVDFIIGESTQCFHIRFYARHMTRQPFSFFICLLLE